MSFINITKLLGGKLLSVEKPARYTGGEYGILSKKDACFQTVIAFPDLYEVGMSNKALYIIYNALNKIDNVSCERVFALPPDVEKLFYENDIPLYGLDNGLVVKDADLLMFTLGYELGITGALSILKSSGIAIHNSERGKERGGGCPIVIAGGPCVSNPLPFCGFIDAFWIGEAEAGFFTLVEKLRDAKIAGKTREELLEIIAEHPNVWVKGKKSASRAVYNGFSFNGTESAVFPVPSIKAIQHHGYAEIMRGCPNGCRFCHAGMWYRPMRQKDACLVIKEVDEIVTKAGYNEISLSSLSSGDYNGIEHLIDALNARYSGKRISFQLPSLHVSTFALDIIEKISKVRKSGLTFAVETPLDYWQISINKLVTLDMICEILENAKKRGWKSAKFYFMIGLPVSGETPNQESEEEAIVNFMKALYKRQKFSFNVNAGVFVPKPHTPYQWDAQLLAGAASKKLFFIKDELKKINCKVSFQDPFVSKIEGIISRGDERAGEWIEEAFVNGARLDAWSEYFKKNIWNDVFLKYEKETEKILLEKQEDEPLKWEVIDSKIKRGYLLSERRRSEQKELTSQCKEKCTHLCGTCGSFNKNKPEIKENTLSCIKNNTTPSELFGLHDIKNHTLSSERGQKIFRVLFLFEKIDKALYLSHLNLVNVFQMALQRAEIDVLFSSGFNPMPLLDFAAPLALGIKGEAEAASVDVCAFIDGKSFTEKLNPMLPEGLIVKEALCVCIPEGVKKHSLASLYWGAAYLFNGEERVVSFAEEKAYKQQILSRNNSFWGLSRTKLFAKKGAETSCYFDLYKSIYERWG